MKIKYFLGTGALLLVALGCLAFSLTDVDRFEQDKEELLLRKIGHELLLQAGDRSSRVLPIQKINADEYQIRFEQELTFQPDSLVELTKRLLAKNQLSKNYRVNVLNGIKKEVIFGYAIASNAQDNIIACSGRVQPKAAYVIDIKFERSGISPMQRGYLVGSLPLLAFIGLLFLRGNQQQKKATKSAASATHSLQLGNTVFDSEKRQLNHEGTITSLTLKENKLLLIFALSPDVIIERNRLQKEIWEDEGVIVGRSLDMFISKLRKKLESDSSLQLLNVHGKGYKLEMGVIG